MNPLVVQAVAALVTLLPASLLPLRDKAHGADGRDMVFWLLLAVAVVGPVSFDWSMAQGAWPTGFATSLWISVAATMLVFAGVAALSTVGWRLSSLLMPYLVVVAALATALLSTPSRPLSGLAPWSWLGVHIAVSVLTYACLTVAAVAGLAVWVQERAIRRRAPNWLSRTLPSVADAERLEVRLLLLGEAVLAIGVVTGMATQYFTTGALLELDHKTSLSIAAFVVIGVMLVAYYRHGMRGRRAARWALLAFLLLTLAFPGVKFVTDVLIG